MIVSAFAPVNALRFAVLAFTPRAQGSKGMGVNAGDRFDGIVRNDDQCGFNSRHRLWRINSNYDQYNIFRRR